MTPPADMKIILIAAMTPDRLIGNKGGLPWHRPADLKHFKQTTAGHAVIMGRRTYESVGRPLPGRRNIVVTRNRAYAPRGAPDDNNTDGATALDVVHGLNEALDLCRQRGERDVFVIGGAQVYQTALDLADEMILTEVPDADYEGDTYFPKWDAAQWNIAGTEQLEDGLRVVTYRRNTDDRQYDRTT